MDLLVVAIVILLILMSYDVLRFGASKKYYKGMLKAEKLCPDFGCCHIPGDLGCEHCNAFFVENWQQTREAKILTVLARRYIYYIEDQHFPAVDVDELEERNDCECLHKHQYDEEEEE